MSIRRLVATAAAMALIAGALAALTPDLSSMAGTLASAQRTADTAGPDVLVMSAAGLLAWAVWGWGALGLALTAASALPGMLGGAARLALHVVLPAGARRGAALALGLGLGVAGPLLGTADAADPHAGVGRRSGRRRPPAPPSRPVAPTARRCPTGPRPPPQAGPLPTGRPCPGGRHPRRRARGVPLAHRERPSARPARPDAHRRRGGRRDAGLVARPTPTSSARTPTCCCRARSSPRRTRREPARARTDHSPSDPGSPR